MPDKQAKKINISRNDVSSQRVAPSQVTPQLSPIEAVTSISDFFKYLADRVLRVKNYKQTILFLSIISAFTFLVALVSVGYFKYLDHDSQRETLKEAAIESILGIMHDPQQIEQGKYTYKYSQSGRAPNGLYQEVEYKNVFQSFDTDFSILRLWADPRNQYSSISANLMNLPSAELITDKILKIKFVRAGWGCDVSIKQQDNKTAHTGKYNCLVVRANGDVNSIGQKEKDKYDGIGFRLRVIDGRGTHWVWGEFTNPGSESKIRYSTKDYMSRPLRLNDTPQSFQFDISTRKKWVRFLDDGGIAPPMAIEDKINFIQAVVIEPGWEIHDGSAPSLDKDKLIDHDRMLGNHITGESNPVPQPASITIHGIYFTNICE